VRPSQAASGSRIRLASSSSRKERWLAASPPPVRRWPAVAGMIARWIDAGDLRDLGGLARACWR
jgi:hypothetical protein